MPFSPFDSVEFCCESEAPQQNQQRQHPEQCLEVRCASRTILKANACFRMERGYGIHLWQAEAMALLDRRERAPGTPWHSLGLTTKICENSVWRLLLLHQSARAERPFKGSKVQRKAQENTDREPDEARASTNRRIREFLARPREAHSSNLCADKPFVCH